MSSRSSIIYVSYDMQCVYRESLYEVAHGDNKTICSPCRYNRRDDTVHISLFVRVYLRFVQQFL